MRQCFARKRNIFTLDSAKEEYSLFPDKVKAKINFLIDELRSLGTLSYPDARKLKGYDLYEMRIKDEEIYRMIYCYVGLDVVVLSGFKKKTQKTPLREIRKALKRRNNISY